MPRSPSLRQILFIASQVPRYCAAAGFGRGRAESAESLADAEAVAEAEADADADAEVAEVTGEEVAFSVVEEGAVEVEE